MSGEYFMCIIYVTVSNCERYLYLLVLWYLIQVVNCSLLMSSPLLEITVCIMWLCRSNKAISFTIFYHHHQHQNQQQHQHQHHHPHPRRCHHCDQNMLAIPRYKSNCEAGLIFVVELTISWIPSDEFPLSCSHGCRNSSIKYI